MIDTSDLTPALADPVRRGEEILLAEGIRLVKVYGLRGFAAQAELYVTIKTNPREAVRRKIQSANPMGLSLHHPGPDGLAWAVDIDADPIAPARDVTPRQRRFGMVMQDLGLTWGGEADSVHVQVAGVTDKWARYMDHARALDRYYRLLREGRIPMEAA